MDQRIINLYDEYTHKPLSRKEFIQRLTRLVGSTAAAMSLLPLLESNYAPSIGRAKPKDLFTEYISWPGVDGEMKAYVARPIQEKAYATVIVIHENRGLNAHIADVARRVARAGYLAVAPNALAPLKTPPANVEERVSKIILMNFEKFKAENLTPATSLTKDLGADSLDFVELIMEFEKEFDTTISDKQAEKLKTVGDIFEHIKTNVTAPYGGTPENEDDARQLFRTLDAEASRQNFISVFDQLKSRQDCNGNFGCVGFCWGGAMANTLAVNVPEMKAAVAFYGRQPADEDVSKIKSAVQLHYAGLDERINAGMEAYENALKNAGVEYEQYVYEGVNHAFHNDTSTARYDAAAAKLAWERTLAFFEKHLTQE